MGGIKCGYRRRRYQLFYELHVVSAAAVKGRLRAEYLLERFIVHEACGVFGYVQLSLLEMLSKLPVSQRNVRHGDDLNSSQRFLESSNRGVESLRGQKQLYAHDEVGEKAYGPPLKTAAVSQGRGLTKTMEDRRK